MEREIKFRGKCIHTGKWVYGDLVINRPTKTYRIIENFGLVCDPVSYKGADLVGCAGDFHNVDPKTVGQFTGIQDKQGNDVYEGSIVIWPHLDSEGTHEIYFDMKELQYSARPLTDHGGIDSCLDSTHMLITGSIHDK